MALLLINYFSKALKRTVPIQAILPSDKVVNFSAKNNENKPFKSLYLLHGYLGNYTDWVSNTNIQLLAEKYNLAVFMPSGDNSFYIDGTLDGSKYSTFIGEELVDMTRKMFHLSSKREDTFICGLSMGGYGALYNGLKYFKTFGYIASFSGALHLFEDKRPNAMKHHDVFGDLTKLGNSELNPRVTFKLMQETLKNKKEKYPKFYISCGKQDHLFMPNQFFATFLKNEGVDVLFNSSDGGHDWDFWQTQIVEVLKWLPLEEPVLGISSGNVKTK